MAVEQYDAIVIGAGQSGGPLTSVLTANGLKTALVERSRVGGTCVNWGCTPTKTMIASARVAHMVHRADDYGVRSRNGAVDMPTVRQRKRDIVDMFHEGSRNAVVSTEGLDLLMGDARFTGKKSICVQMNDGGCRELTAGKIFINAGTRPSVPDLPGIDSIPWHDSTTVMELDHVPDHLMILGGGYVGLEFAQMFRRFGAEVTVIQRSPQLLKNEDWDMANQVREILEQDGIRIHLSTSVESFELTGCGQTLIKASGEDGPVTVTGSDLLIAAGRQPNTDHLQVDQTGLEINERGFIPVNERLETEVDGIWAMGDITGGPAFTHISYDDYRILSKNLFGGGGASTSERIVPYVVFMDPELGRVGLSEKQAREAGYEVKIASMPMSAVARAIETDETRGMMKAVIDASNDQILGAAILGISGGEIMSILQVAMLGKMPYMTLRDTPFAHPTVAEALNNLFSNVE